MSESEKIKYSVIIPIYNAEKTLTRCIDSLLSQNRNDIQIVAVNDGSIDHSNEIMMEYASKYAVIDYIWQDNAGVSRARNTGLAHANGTYITFVDSDDYVSPDYFTALDRAEACDLLVFANQNIGGAPQEESELFLQLQKLETSDQRLALLLSSRKIMPPWNKRFKRSLIEQNALRFIEGMQIGEDFNFCLAYALQCQSINIISDQIVYIDVSDQASLSRKYRPHLDDQMVAVFQNSSQTIKNGRSDEAQAAKLLTIADYLFIKNVFTCISEEFKKKPLHYLHDRKQIIEICKKFQVPISSDYCSTMHRILRFALKHQFYYPFYFVSYLVKGRNYKPQTG